jgi:hypothetical protein
VLQKEATDLIDHGRPLADQTRSHAVQCPQVQLIISLYRNEACRWSLYRFRDRVGIPEVVLMTLTERLGIGRRALPHIMTERQQLARQIVRGHASLDPDQARRHIREPGPNPIPSNLLAQNDRPPLIQAN